MYGFEHEDYICANPFHHKNLRPIPWPIILVFKTLELNLYPIRDVAQPGSALRSGRRGRWFESSHPDFESSLNLYSKPANKYNQVYFQFKNYQLLLTTSPNLISGNIKYFEILKSNGFIASFQSEFYFYSSLISGGAKTTIEIDCLFPRLKMKQSRIKG